MKHGIFKVLFAVAVAVLLASSAWAGGLYLYEVGSADTGLAGAGYASRAQDASTLFTNPAGMTRLEKQEIDAGAQLIYLHTKFSPNGDTSPIASNVPTGSIPGYTAANGNPSGFIPAGGLFYTNKLSNQVAVGFGIFGFFGLASEYEDNWLGRYYATKIQLQGLTLMPSVAYKLNDKISFGAGLNAMYGTLDTKMAVNNRELGNLTAPDGSMEIKDNAWGYGGKFGVLYEMSKGTRMGLTYLTKTKLDFSVNPSLTNVTRTGLATILSNLTIDMTVRAPQQFILSGYHELSDKLAVMGDLGWENWQDFGQIDTGVYDQSGGSVTTTVNAHYQNTWHVALGAQYKLSDVMKVSGGAAYDSSMVDGANRTPTLPVGATWRFAGGAQYAMSPTMTFTGGYEYIWTGNMAMDVNRGPLAGRVAGEYTNMCIQVLTLAANWKF
jgi:long-chain fatty acid transport protein